MEINIVKSGGFCFGVERAVNKALNAAEQYRGKNIFTIGHIIHNNDIVKKLKEKGIEPVKIENVKNIKDSVVILRSHGVEKDLMEILKKNNNKIIDAICPFVKKIHDIVNKLKKENYFIVVVGDKGHPEVKAIYSFTNINMSIIISNKDELNIADLLEKKKVKKIGIVAQTTQDFKNFSSICYEFLKIKGEIRIFNTICNATSNRQKETIEVAKKVDLMLVIGGKHSANTTRLKELSLKYLNKVFHIENKNELKKDWFEGVKSIGITAGASTPKFVIDEVVEAIKIWSHSKFIIE